MTHTLWYVFGETVIGNSTMLFVNQGERFVTRHDWIFDGSICGISVKIKRIVVNGVFCCIG
jgi:hypothetical protein